MHAIAVPETSYYRFVEILQSEFLKLRSVRSTFWTLFSTLLFNIGFAVLAAIFLPGVLTDEDKANIDGVRLCLGGLHLSQIAIGVLGVLVIASEYSTGMIRSTFSAVPQRRTVLAAKGVVFTATALAVGIVSSFVAYFSFQALLPADDLLQSSITDPGVFRAVAGGGLYLAVIGLLGFGLGVVIRVSAGAIATLVGMLFVPPILLSLLPRSWQTTIGPYMPMEAGGQIFIAAKPEPNSLEPWTGFSVFCLYALVAVVIGFALINRRDA